MKNTATAEPLPSLTAGHGLPGRQISLSDGRTSLRLDAGQQGFDLLAHYAPDSWFRFSRVLQADGAAMRWTVDGAPHPFDWTEVWPFGYRNREERAGATVASECVVEQGVVLWRLSGVRDEAVLTLPRRMLADHHAQAGGEEVETGAWTLPRPDARGPWRAVRQETWLFRDTSTFSGLAGKTVPSKWCSSRLHLVIRSGTGLRVTETDGVLSFRLPPADGEAALVLALGSTRREAEQAARQALADGPQVLARQMKRYARVDGAAPRLDFGRHTAMARFFRLEPLYMESMRIRDDMGAFKANNDYYWVWGWDMTRPAFGLLCGNRRDMVKGLLELRFAHGCIDQYDNTLRKDQRAGSHRPGALECLLLHDYLAWSGDEAGVRRWLPQYVRAAKALAAEPDPTGMGTGTAASTDFPEEFGRTFPARLAYRAAWLYGGLLGLEKVLRRFGEADVADRILERALRMRRHFVPVFWNEQTGFWNEGVHPENPDLLCDIPLSTALAAMDSPYGEDLYGGKLLESARFATREFLRDDGVHITRRGEVRGWKEWTRQANNWFAANDTMLARLFRAVGDTRSLERLFYLYEINFGYQPAAFEGKPFRRPLLTSGSWQAFGAASWYRNLVEAAAGLWVDLGGAGIMPGGLGEPVHLSGVRVRGAVLDVRASGQGAWPRSLTLDGQPVVGTTKLPPLRAGAHRIEVEYHTAAPPAPLLTLAVDAEVRSARVEGRTLEVVLKGRGYTPVSFFSPGPPAVACDGEALPAEYDAATGRGRARCMLAGKATLTIASA